MIKIIIYVGFIIFAVMVAGFIIFAVTNNLFDVEEKYTKCKDRNYNEIVGLVCKDSFTCIKTNNTFLSIVLVTPKCEGYR